MSIRKTRKPKKVTIKITYDLLKELRAAKKKLGASFSQIIGRALHAYLPIPAPDPMLSYPTLRDLKTGKTKTIQLAVMNFSWWTTGAGNCDCHRARLMRTDKERQTMKMPKTCLGYTRFVVVDVRGPSSAQEKAEALATLNAQYPSGSWEQKG